MEIGVIAITVQWYKMVPLVGLGDWEISWCRISMTMSLAPQVTL